MTQTIAAHFDTRAHADQAVRELTANGVQPAAIHVINDSRIAHENKDRRRDAGPADIAIGALGGAFVGGLIGFLSGTLLKLIPGINALIAASELTAAVGLGLANMIAGALLGALLGMLLGAAIWARYRYHASPKVPFEGAVVEVDTTSGDRSQIAAIMRRHGAAKLALQ